MSKFNFNIAVICVSVFACTGAMTQTCGFPPKELVQSSNERREYRGTYANGAYGYSAVIPDNLVGYDDPNPFYQHGFGIRLGSPPQSYLLVNGDPNSLEYVSAAIAAKTSLKFLRRHARRVESTKMTQGLLDDLTASFLVATYTCPGSKERFVKASMFALSPDKSTVYEVTLYAVAGRYDHERAVLDRVLNSWKYTKVASGG